MDPTIWLKLLLYVTVAVGIYYTYRLTRNALKVLSDLFVAYQVISGGSTLTGTKRSSRMYAFTCESQYLDEVTVTELYNFLMSFVKSEIGEEDKTIAALHKVLLSYSHIIMFRDKIDGSLRGMMTVGFLRKKDYTIMKLGLSFFKNFYRGGPYFYFAPGLLGLKEMIRHPLTPLYVLGKAYGYHSYLVAMNFSVSYPRYNRETPAFFKEMFKEYAYSVMAEGDTYDEETNVLVQERTHLEEGVSTITEEKLKIPHIKFFAERNPGYTKGHCLVSGWRMSWIDLFTLFREIFNRAASKTPRKKSSAKRPKLLRRQTFQEESANAYATELYHMGWGGEAIPVSPSKDAFVVGQLSPTHNFDFSL